MGRPKLVYLVSEDWYFVSHRLPLAVAAKAAGFDVFVVTRVGQEGARIRDAGLGLIPVAFERSGLNPRREIMILKQLLATYRAQAPDIVHNVSIKPVIYGSIAAAHARVAGTVNALMGLGWVFSSQSPKARIMRPFVKAALRAALSPPKCRVIVQNGDDARCLIAEQLAPAERIRLIRGSGVDLAAFTAHPPPPDDVPLIVLPGRLLAAKGVREFAAAAGILKARGVRARFALVGAPDADNPATLTDRDIGQLVAQGHVEHWGWRQDMASVLRQSSLVCLPTYYGEGLPKALLEAAASGRAIVTTDVPGCRELVRSGENGWLVPPRNVTALADALQEALARPGLCAQYAVAGRTLVEREFSQAAIIAQTLAVYRELVKPRAQS